MGPVERTACDQLAEFPYLKDPEFGFNPSIQARFRKWLQAKYETLADINAAWYRTFTNWDQVEAPRFPTILSSTDYIYRLHRLADNRAH